MKSHLLLLLCLLWFPFQSQGADRDASFYILPGEAFAPSHYRIGVLNYDVGIEGRGRALYIGKRFWKQGIYVGVGGSIHSSGGLGIYGFYGMEVIVWKFIGLSAEFFGIGNHLGEVHGLAYLGLGVVL